MVFLFLDKSLLSGSLRLSSSETTWFSLTSDSELVRGSHSSQESALSAIFHVIRYDESETIMRNRCLGAL